MNSFIQSIRKLNSRLTLFSRVLIVILVIASIGAGYAVYANRDTSFKTQEEQYAEEKSLIEGQNQQTPEDIQEIDRINQQPLLQEIPYRDEFIFIDTTDESTHLGVQYTGSLKQAQARYQEILKYLKDSGTNYEVNFEKVDALPPIEPL